MTAIDTASKQELGHKAMQKKITAAAAVRRSFRARPPRRKDIVLSPSRALVDAWALRDELQTAMGRVSLPRSDAEAALLLLTGDLDDERQEKVYVYQIPEMAGVPALYEKVMELAHHTTIFPLGVVFKQYDRQSDTPNTPEVWTLPWLVFPNASRALHTVAERYVNLEFSEEVLYQPK